MIKERILETRASDISLNRKREESHGRLIGKEGKGRGREEESQEKEHGNGVHDGNQESQTEKDLALVEE